MKKTRMVICNGCGRMIYRRLGTHRKPCRRCLNAHTKRMEELNRTR